MTADPEEWRDRAACRNPNPPDLMFPGSPDTAAASKAVCQHCTVRLQCRSWAERMRINVGTYDGEDEWARRKRLRLPPPASIQAGDLTASTVRKRNPKPEAPTCEWCDTPLDTNRRFCDSRCQSRAYAAAHPRRRAS